MRCVVLLDALLLAAENSLFSPFSVSATAGQESPGSTDVDSRHAIIDECNTGVGPRTASRCYQHSGLYMFQFLTDCFAWTVIFASEKSVAGNLY